MAVMYYSKKINVDADSGWAVIEKYTRAESHLFKAAEGARMETVAETTAERPAGLYRVVTVAGTGDEIYELDVSVDNEHRRLSYTVPGLFGAVHHHASMQVFSVDENTSELVYITDVLPDSFAEQFGEFYEANFHDLADAVERG
ncbi:hypothetical protein HQO27_01850 [Rhodococcus fascians]|nr:hypothetical protein [Rhodococcus fascians]MBY4237839.1 hypothetical protein [Rhodococcus fascians]MBY4253410.1 hypothetical protein [Rhodococcus fascians]MBY4269047.1 hypothetical protein [Rhodococcus fascians]MBY4275100.1 hypothetical protein [Rhodococcus fascians]